MNNRKKFLQWLNNPKWYFFLPIMLIAIGSTVGGTLIVVQPHLSQYSAWGFALLGIAGVTLSYSIFAIVRLYPDVKARILQWAKKYPRIDKVFNEYGFTTLIFTAISIIITFAIATYNGLIAIGIVFSPEVPSNLAIWFASLAAYYIVLIILRSSILVYYGKRKRALNNGQSEKDTLMRDCKLYRACGIMLFLLPVCLSFTILQMVRAGESFEHKGVTIYVNAIYAFYKIISSIYSFIKERRNNSMVIMATKNVKLADAMVSILALQTAMFREFGSEMQGFEVNVMNALMGAVVCGLTVVIGVIMIVKANSRIKKLKQQTTDDTQ